MTSDSEAAQRRIPWALLLLILMFVGPLVGAVWLFGQTDVWRPQSSHYGILVEPVLPLRDYTTELPEELAPEILRGRWSLLLIWPQPYPEESAQLLHDLHQLHVAVGKHADRLQRVVVTDGALPVMAVAAEQDPHLRVIRATRSGLTRLQARLPGATRGLFLVDPLGNLMLRYPVPPALRGVLDDLRRLLRTSRIG